MKDTYIIIENVSVYIPGDERSRTAPGHGYPAHTDTYQKVSWYYEELPWKAAVERLAHGRVSFKAGKFIEAKVGLEAKVEFET